MSYVVVSYHITSHLHISYHIKSYHIISCHVIPPSYSLPVSLSQPTALPPSPSLAHHPLPFLPPHLSLTGAAARKFQHGIDDGQIGINVPFPPFLYLHRSDRNCNPVMHVNICSLSPFFSVLFVTHGLGRI